MGSDAARAPGAIADQVQALNRSTDAAAAHWPPSHRVTGMRLMAGMIRAWRAARRAPGGAGDEPDRLIDAGLSAFAAFLIAAKAWERQRPPARRSAFDGAEPADGARRLPQVSAVVLCRNEAARISRCLDSLRWAGEVVIVDGESEDETPAIARARGARVVSRPFSGSYAEERNAGAAAAQGPWVLQLDADEIVTERFRRRLEAVLAEEGDRLDALRFQRRSVLLGRPMRYGGWVHYIPNLYRKDRVRYTGLVHERLEGAERIGLVEAPIDHYAMEALSPYLVTQNRYTTLFARELWQRRGRIPADEVRYQLARKPLKIAWKSYVKKQGFREGMHGLILAVLYGWVHVLSWAKYWEYIRDLDGEK